MPRRSAGMLSSITLIVLALGFVLGVIGLVRFRLSALESPGPLETRVANDAKHILIRLESREEIPPQPPVTDASIEAGATHFGLDCTICHGVDGRSQTPSGQWMYPRAADLTSMRVQSYSDQELFWVINNGVRFTGMPAFGKIETPEHVWALVAYVRTLQSRNPGWVGRKFNDRSNAMRR